ncbi:hypothetical protein GCM10023185_00280 [Hymenobacter saemangeumensis]|uniref:Glycosyltransferase n=1 Tax=Hymenobacter saemangeumensis TaxID=1084522 RepID=A0ABP8HWM8_9BACT
MKNQCIIMFCQQSWDIGIATNARSLAREFAKDNRVLYVNMPLDVHTVFRVGRQPDVRKRLQVLAGQQPSLLQAEPNVWVLTPRGLALSINWLPSRRLFAALNRVNSRWLAASIGQAAQALGFGSYVLFQDSIIFQGLELKQLLRPKASVYYLRDYMLGVPYFRRHGPWVEACLLEQADVVATNSAYLGDYARRHNPNTHNIGQGCVLGMYQADTTCPRPADLAPVKQASLVYTGFLTALRLDIGLLLAIARQRPHWDLVLIGPEDAAFRRSELHGLPNVYFLGAKPPEQLAAYLQHADVCINPQVLNETTLGNYPLKIDEYLAMGKPVVATHTRTMELFAQHVYLASGPAHWLQLLDRAMAEGGPSPAADRIAFARSHTWAASVAVLYTALDSLPMAKTLSKNDETSKKE